MKRSVKAISSAASACKTLDKLLLRIRVLQVEPYAAQGQSSNTREGKPAEGTLAVRTGPKN